MQSNITYLPVKATYDLWAPTYDSDGNILQALDSYGSRTTLLPRLIASLPPQDTDSRASEKGNPLQVIDLGCGTGRVIIALLEALKDVRNVDALARCLISERGDLDHGSRGVRIKGLDACDGMLKIAEARISSENTINLNLPECNGGRTAKEVAAITIETNFQLYDIHATVDPSYSPGPADVVLCSLVLEHLPSVLDFFAHLVKAPLIKKDGFLLLTNMHPEMAKGPQPTDNGAKDPITGRLISQAGFKLASGNKVRPVEDWAHTISDVEEAATAYGFKLVGNHRMEELKVERWMIEQGLVDSQRGEKWTKGGVMCWFGGLFRYTSNVGGSLDSAGQEKEVVQ